MAKVTKKASKPATSKKVTTKAKTLEAKELKLDKAVEKEVEQTPVVENFNQATQAPAAKETSSNNDWSDDEDMDSIGNKVEGGPNAGGVEVTLRAPVTRTGVNPEPGEEYSLMVHFDKANGQYVASILEFPEISVSGPNKGNVLLELQDKLETQMIEVKRQGQNLPEPIQAKKYPEVLEVPVSQALFRKLDILSRQEKVALEKLVSEMIAGAVEKRFDGRRQTENRPQQNFSQNNNQPRHNNQNRDQRHHHNRGQHHNQNRRPQQGYSQNAAGGQDNFMEYVRNLEKGGGSNWKKR